MWLYNKNMLICIDLYNLRHAITHNISLCFTPWQSEVKGTQLPFVDYDVQGPVLATLQRLIELILTKPNKADMIIPILQMR